MDLLPHGHWVKCLGSQQGCWTRDGPQSYLPEDEDEDDNEDDDIDFSEIGGRFRFTGEPDVRVKQGDVPLVSSLTLGLTSRGIFYPQGEGKAAVTTRRGVLCDEGSK
jgi:hypothetical protein